MQKHDTILEPLKNDIAAVLSHGGTNPVLANLAAVHGAALRPREAQTASSYFLVERTFSECALSV